jgi:hypothetical protein
MTGRKTHLFLAGAVAFFTAFSGLAGEAAEKPAGSQEAVSLAYKFAEGAALSYKQTGTQTQNIDVMGQMMTTDMSASLDITLKPKGRKDANFVLGVTIDGITSNVQGPQGSLTADMSAVIGKGFDLVFSPLGEEVDVSGAAAYFMDLGQGDRHDLTSEFQGLFPDLPDHPVKAGDKWPSVDTIVEKSESGEIKIVFNNENMLDGFETIDGRECARIKIVARGTLTGTGSQGGMSFDITANLNGDALWFFAVKEGILVKRETKAAIAGTISAQGMDIGLSGDQQATLALVQK